MIFKRWLKRWRFKCNELYIRFNLKFGRIFTNVPIIDFSCDGSHILIVFRQTASTSDHIFSTFSFVCIQLFWRTNESGIRVNCVLFCRNWGLVVIYLLVRKTNKHLIFITNIQLVVRNVNIVFDSKPDLKWFDWQKSLVNWDFAALFAGFRKL